MSATIRKEKIRTLKLFVKKYRAKQENKQVTNNISKFPISVILQRQQKQEQPYFF